MSEIKTIEELRNYLIGLYEDRIRAYTVYLDEELKDKNPSEFMEAEFNQLQLILGKIGVDYRLLTDWEKAIRDDYIATFGEDEEED